MIEALLVILMIVLCVIMIIVVSAVIIPKVFSKQIDRYLDIRNKEAMNAEYELYNNFDIKHSQELINEMIDDYISKYVLYNFASSKKEYIGDEDAKTLIKEVTKNILVDMSDYYLFLFKMNKAITSDDDLMIAVMSIVEERGLLHITQLNKPKQ